MSQLPSSYDFHRYANLFPMMQEAEFASLAEDIGRSGLREKIWLFQGLILDGRNRYLACEKSGVMPQFRNFTGTEDDALQAVLSWNLERRHLSSSQKAAIAVELEDLFAALEAQARERRKASGGDRKSEVYQESVRQIFDAPIRDTEHPNRNEGRATAQAATAMGTNRQYVNDAKKLRDTAPALLERVRQGGVTMPQAKEIAKLPENKQEEILETVKAAPDPEKQRKLIREAVAEASREARIEKIAEIAKGNDELPASEEGSSRPSRFPVIYADPPWRYEHVKTESRAIENQYPTMSLEEICDLDVAGIATPDAILFMWATSPKLAESLQVVEAWGFTYRTCAVWVKDKIGMGYYFRQQHELLLVCTRGNIPAPPVESRVSSVIEGDRTQHSVKPPRFAEIIEGMYPELPKLEMFCRTPRPGWSVWGNQSKSGGL